MSKIEITDIGVNLHCRQYSPEGVRDNVLKNAYNSNVKSIISITNSLKEAQHNIDYCKKYTEPKVYCTIGVHPHNAKELTSAIFAAFL